MRRDERLRFAAPPLTRSGPVAAAEAARVVTALGLDPADVLETAWVDNGPGWIGVLVRSPEAVLAAAPDPSLCAGLKAGFVAVYPPGARDDGVAAEVRAFYSDGRDFAEDPVTGSLNAGLAQWLVPAGHLPEHYVAAQGTVIGRDGPGARRRRRRHRLGRRRDPHRRHRRAPAPDRPGQAKRSPGRRSVTHGGGGRRGAGSVRTRPLVIRPSGGRCVLAQPS